MLEKQCRILSHTPHLHNVVGKEIVQIMKTTVPLLVPTISLIYEQTMNIKLPPTKFFHDGDLLANLIDQK